MKNQRPSEIPLNEEASFTPRAVLCVKEEKGTSGRTTLTPATPVDIGGNVSSLELDDLTAKASGNPASLWFQSQGMLQRSIKGVDGSSGATVVELSGPILDLGHWNLTFPPQSTHSSHTIEQRPVAMASRDDVFVKDSVPYFWMAPESGFFFTANCVSRLYKVVGSKRVEVARFATKRQRDRDGVLFVDDSQVDLVVAAATCMAMTRQLDSFRK